MPRLHGEVCLYDILPSTEDYQELKENFSIVLAHVMTDNLSFFSEKFMGLVQRHVPHQYSCEMSTNQKCIGGGNGAVNTASAVPNSYQGRLSRANHLAS